MATVWTQVESDWAVTSLPQARFALRGDAGQSAVLAPVDARGPWVLLARPGSSAEVNGAATCGIRILSHRDEIRLGDKQWYFSTERIVRAEPFAGPAGTCCARCGEEIVPGSPAAQCGCGLYYHQAPEWGCFLYADICRACEAPTRLDAEYQWTPEGL